MRGLALVRTNRRHEASLLPQFLTQPRVAKADALGAGGQMIQVDREVTE